MSDEKGTKRASLLLLGECEGQKKKMSSELLNAATVRRSTREDVPAVEKIISDEVFIFRKRYVEDLNLHYIIQTQFLTVSVVGADGAVLGLAAFSDEPTAPSGLSAVRWEDDIKSGSVDLATVKDILPCNTLFLTFFAACAQVDAHELLRRLLSTALATVPTLYNILYALPRDVPTFDPVCSCFQPIPRTDVPAAKRGAGAVDISCTLYYVRRRDIIPELKLRAGVVEDYDDLMPLLLSGEGVVTPLPENLFLEELLQDQDAYHAVVVGEDPATGAVVGLMCLAAVFEEQQHVVKQYATDAYNKLKPIGTQQQKPGQQAGHNAVRITFFYINPAYDTRAQQFIPYAFSIFSFAEYCFVFLPHAAPEHPLLHSFVYVPIKRFQPTNLQGERLPCRRACGSPAATCWSP